MVSRCPRRTAANIASALLVAVLLVLASASAATARLIVLPTVSNEIRMQRAVWAQAAHPGIAPPAIPCPENGLLPELPGSPVSLGNCGVPETPATTLPWPGNMAYHGGHVELHPKVYLVFWGWGEPGAFPGRSCRAERLSEGKLQATLACDPDGAGKYMADFVHQMGGTRWAAVSSQFYELDRAGAKHYISNDRNILAGVWADDTNDIRGLPKTTADNPPGPTNTYHQLAAEAQRAVAHFHITDLQNADVVVAQPPAYTDPNAIASGYCAFHDFTLAAAPGNGYYAGIEQGIAYTNMPYVNAIDSGGQNDCGEYSVGGVPGGKLDGFSIALGHEIEEAITDPAAEDIVGNTTTAGQMYYGGWYDAVDANENGDKCAYVGTPLNQVLGLPNLPGEPRVPPVPGAVGTITGNAGGRFAVQSLWSNDAAGGLGYCAGVNDLPPGLDGGATASAGSDQPGSATRSARNRRTHRQAWRQGSARRQDRRRTSARRARGGAAVRQRGAKR